MRRWAPVWLVPLCVGLGAAAWAGGEYAVTAARALCAIAVVRCAVRLVGWERRHGVRFRVLAVLRGAANARAAGGER